MEQKKRMSWLLEEEDGQGMVEYALLLAFIALLAYAALGSVGDKLVGFYTKAAQAFDA